MTSDRRTLMRAIRGPVLLITLGALFTADYFYGLPFHRTWPVLLIVFGIMKLLERVGAERVAS
jgi:hypothetical protein